MDLAGFLPDLARRGVRTCGIHPTEPTGPEAPVPNRCRLCDEEAAEE